MVDVLLINRSTLVTAAQMTAWAAAYQTQVTDHLKPYWGVDATIHFGPAEIPGAWNVIFQDDADDPNDLGFHLVDNGLPESRIFVRLTQQIGDEPSSVGSHEVCEMLCDPSAALMAADNVHVREVCDPVQESRYRIGEVVVSNFVTPAYFNYNTSRVYDYLKQLDGPIDRLLPGGYIMYLADGRWQQKFGQMTRVAAERALMSGRSSWRRIARP